MGRYDFRNMRVHDAAALLLKTRPRYTATPPWFETMTDYPPTTAVVRSQPVQQSTPTPKFRKFRKPSRMFMPQNITLDEDKLRREFYADHPWELARPRVVLENDGRDLYNRDWSQPYQMGRPVDGESVIQRQQWLMTVGPQGADGVRQPMSKEAAYDKARKEFYERRHFDEIEARVAREEALAVGAEFGMTANEVGDKLESQEFERWKAWAHQQITIMEQAKSTAFGATGDADADTENKPTTLDDIGDSLTAEPTNSGSAAEKKRKK